VARLVSINSDFLFTFIAVVCMLCRCSDAFGGELHTYASVQWARSTTDRSASSQLCHGGGTQLGRVFWLLHQTEHYERLSLGGNVQDGCSRRQHGRRRSTAQVRNCCTV